MTALTNAETVEEEGVAKELWEATRTHALVPASRLRIAHASLSAGYRVQRLNVARWKAEGRRVRGYKIAMTTKLVQQQFGIDGPTSGVLFDDMFTEGPIASADVPQARVEAEVAFVMGTDIEGFPRTPEATLDAVGYALSAIEVVSCRISGWDVSAFDFVADNAAAALVVLGTAQLEIRDCDWVKLSMVMDINGRRRASSGGAVYEESPMSALHWLALQLAVRKVPLRRGDVVMSGSLGPAIPVEAGDRVQVRLGSQPPVDAHFV